MCAVTNVRQFPLKCVYAVPSIGDEDGVEELRRVVLVDGGGSRLEDASRDALLISLSTASGKGVALVCSSSSHFFFCGGPVAL